MLNNQNQVRLFTTGYCHGDNKHIHKGGKKQLLKFHALWALIEHHKLGKIIFDTGYSSRFDTVTRKFPFVLYRMATPVFHKEENSCIRQLQHLGLQPSDINHLIISHFHADHICGLMDFPETPIWCSKSAKDHFYSKNNYSGVVKGYLKPLVPENISASHPETALKESTFGPFRAWIWEEDLIFIDLPGHCRGQIGLIIKNTNMGTVFLAADSTWSSKAFREKIYPSKLVKVFVDDYKALTSTIDKLHDFHQQFPDILILPTHCEEVAQNHLSNAL